MVVALLRIHKVVRYEAVWKIIHFLRPVVLATGLFHFYCSVLFLLVLYIVSVFNYNVYEFT